MAAITAKATRLPSNLTIEVAVVITRRLRFRVWCAKHLICLAARVLGCNIVVNEGERQWQ
jgi:hypothetical protein